MRVIIDWFKKQYALQGLTWPKIIFIAIFVALFKIVGVWLERLGNYLLDQTIAGVPSLFQTIGQWVLNVIFYPVNTNLLTLTLGVIVFVPLYHYMVKFFLKRKVKEVIFTEDFSRFSPHNWYAPYWGGRQDTVSKINGYMAFSARPGEWNRLTPDENGALYDITSGVYEGFTYQVQCKAKCDSNTTMGFKLWVHDTEGGAGRSVSNPSDGFDTPGTELKDYSVKFKATKTNAIRIHLHCKAGQGRILVKEVVVTKL
jgi:hypothetical protein